MAESQAGPTEQFLEFLGREVRRRRRTSEMTMQDLADRSGLSRRMVSNIELGQANPSLVTVAKVARALGTDFTSLTRETSVDALVVNAPGSVPGIWSSPAGSRAALAVASTVQPPAEMWDWTLVPGDRYDAEPDPPGSEELFLVITGTLSLLVDGEVAGSLGPGGSARVNTDRDYGYRNDGNEPVRFIRVAHTTP